MVFLLGLQDCHAGFSRRVFSCLAVGRCCWRAALSATRSIPPSIPRSAGRTRRGAPDTGLAVGDEPFAVKTGTAILGEGGSAADAVTAMFFAMTATYPVAAGLGGGGICLVADPVKGIREFDFLPRAAKAGGAFAVPGAARGFYDLQTAYRRVAVAARRRRRRGFCRQRIPHQSCSGGAARQSHRRDPARPGAGGGISR